MKWIDKLISRGVVCRRAPGETLAVLEQQGVFPGRISDEVGREVLVESDTKLREKTLEKSGRLKSDVVVYPSSSNL